MKVIAAYLLACLGGNAQPSSSDVQSILNSVGIDIDEKRLQHFMSQVDGKDISEVIASGRQKLASVPSGGGACVAVGAGGASPTTGGAAPAAESKSEKVEEKEESDDDMGFSLLIERIGLFQTSSHLSIVVRT